MTWCQPTYFISDAESFVSSSARSWEKGGDYSFAILDAKGGTFLGRVGLNDVDYAHALGNIGSSSCPDLTNQWGPDGGPRQGLAKLSSPRFKA